MDINATLLGQMITFALFVAFTMKFVWPPLTGALAERQKKVADGIAAGERGKQELALAQKKATELIKTAKLDGARIVELARKQSDKIVDDAKQQALAENKRIVEAAYIEIEQLKTNMRDSLRKEVVALAVNGAEKILMHSIDETANKALITDLVENM